MFEIQKKKKTCTQKRAVYSLKKKFLITWIVRLKIDIVDCKKNPKN